ncbi:aminotransferase class V-fold PLP-dependent enzyme [Candidatus Peregrinibacteria bacterium]|nr:aminotransferase class V-fold PLP-dependent enzyme [Candidatus Peregrinibacteria bacterium]
METLNPSLNNPTFLDRLLERLRTKTGSASEQAETIRVPESFQRTVCEFLHTCFCLPIDQIPYEVVESIFKVSDKLSPTPNDIKVVLGANTHQSRLVLSQSLRHHLGETIQLSRDEIDTILEDLSRLIIDLRNEEDLHIQRLCERNSTIRQRVEHLMTVGSHFNLIHSDRLEAVRETNRLFPEVVSQWDENPHALNDEEMAPFFVRSDHLMEGVDNFGSRFLTTYADSAQFGLENRLLSQEATRLSRQRMDFMEFMGGFKEAVIRHFEPKRYADLQAQMEGRHEPLRFTRPMENLFVAGNGTGAFQLFSEAYIRPGETVLVTPQEYGEIVAILQDKAHVFQLPDTPEALVELLKNIQVDYALVSELSRHGNPFPLAWFREVLDRHAPQTDLIVDGAQSIGRRVIDFSKIRPSVLVGSIQKGSNVGSSPLGLLMLSDDFLNRRGLSEMVQEKGSVGHEALGRLVAACTPEYLGTLAGSNENISKDVLQKMTISVEERQKAVQQMVRKFLQLVQAINQRCGNRIEILNPVGADNLSCILTCKVRGLERRTVKGIAKGRGVTINHYWDELEEGVSFRIAFHPFMNNNALKIMGYALMEAALAA